MFKSLVVLAALSTMSSPAFAETTPPAQSQNSAGAPQTVKKRVCYQEEEDSYSRLGGRKVCKTVEVPASGGAQGSQQAPASNSTSPQGR
jgi:hypothetical protein